MLFYQFHWTVSVKMIFFFWEININILIYSFKQLESHIAENLIS